MNTQVADGSVHSTAGCADTSMKGVTDQDQAGGAVPSDPVKEVRKRIASKRAVCCPPKEEVVDEGGPAPSPTTPLTVERVHSPTAESEFPEAPKADENASGTVPGGVGTVLDAQNETLAVQGGPATFKDTVPAINLPKHFAGSEGNAEPPAPITEGAAASVKPTVKAASTEAPKADENASGQGGPAPSDDTVLAINRSEPSTGTEGIAVNLGGAPIARASTSTIGGAVPEEVKQDEYGSEFGGSVPDDRLNRPGLHPFESFGDGSDAESPDEFADAEEKLKYALKYPERTGVRYLANKLSNAERAVLYKNMARATGEYTKGSRAERVKKLWSWIRDSHSQGAINQTSTKESMTRMASSWMTAHEVSVRFGADAPLLMQHMEKRRHPLHQDVIQYRYLEDSSSSQTTKTESMALSSTMSMSAEDASMARGHLASQNLQMTLPPSALNMAQSHQPKAANTKASAKAKAKTAPKQKAGGKRKAERTADELAVEALSHEKAARKAFEKERANLSAVMAAAVNEKITFIENHVQGQDELTEETLEEIKQARISVLKMVKLR